MDGISALSLVCSVLQVAEYSYKIVSKASELSSTANGTLIVNQETESCAKELLHRNLRLAQSLERSKAQDKWDDDDIALEALGRDCNDVAVRLIDRLKRLESKTARGTFYKSIRQALKTVANKDEIDSIAERMKAFQEQIDSRIIQSTSLRLKLMAVEQTQNFRDLEDGERRILDLSKLHHRQLTNQINSQTDFLQRLIETQIQSLGSQLLQSYPLPEGYPIRSLSPGVISAQIDTGYSDIWDLVRDNNKPELQALLYRDPSAVKARNQRGRTALHEAASMGNEKLVAYLIRNDAIINAEDVQDATPLHLAVKSGSIATTRLLLLRGADADAEDFESKKPLAYAEGEFEIAWALEYGHHVDAKDNAGDTALHVAARRGEDKSVRSLLGQRANVHLYNNKGWQPLHEAIQKRATGIPILLLEAGADPKSITTDDRRDTALGRACLNGDLATVKRLLELGAEVNKLNTLHYSPLSEACHSIRYCSQSQDIALHLVQKGANVHEQDGRGYKPVHVACFNGGDRVVEIIIKAFGDQAKTLINEGSSATHWTPLTEAARHGYLDIVQHLLEHGAQSNGNSDARPICKAATFGHLGVVRLLLQQPSIDVNCVDGDAKFTPIMEAARHGHVDVLRLLLTRAPDLRKKHNGKQDALGLSITAGKSHAIRILIEEGGMDVNAISTDMAPPLSQAVEANQLDAVKTLISLGANMDLPALRTGYSPLHFAVMVQDFQSVGIFGLLLEHGAHVNALDVYGWTALHRTVQRSSLERVRILLEAGADPTIRTSDSTPHDSQRNLTPRELWQSERPYGWKEAAALLEQVEKRWGKSMEM